MANYRNAQETADIQNRVLLAAAKLFLTKGFADATVKEISAAADINTSTLMYVFGSKEEILCELVKYVIEAQFNAAEKIIEGKTDDRIYFYAVETTLQLYMAESDEHIRNLYSAAYSMPKSSEIIQFNLTNKLQNIFKEHLPKLETKDFYELEIASGGIMRGFMTIPCDMYFTMERKVKRFLETTFLVYRVPQEKIEKIIEFVFQFDYNSIAKDTIESMLQYLESKSKI